MNQFVRTPLASRPATISILVTALCSIRFLDVLPFSDFTRLFNYETVTTLVSYFIYAREPFSFPLGQIVGLTYPYADANIGNVGALPLFAIIFKSLGKIFPYFQTFDYFVFVELLSCFVTALFAQKILLRLGVKQVAFRVLGAFLTGMSFVLLTRSAMTQTFCVVAFPIFMAWIYAALLSMQRGKWKPRQDLAIITLFPIAALLDNYTLFGILLATFALLGRELFEAIFGGLESSWNRVSRILFYCVGGTALSLFALYLIGMYPLPSFSHEFTSYGFGAGGRYHVADLFGPLIPVFDNIGSSLLGKMGFPFTTGDLGSGQYEGLAYMGTAALLLWFLLATGWLWNVWSKPPHIVAARRISNLRMRLCTPWTKIAVATSVVFVYSLGYELIVLGHPFPDFAGMPAAWISDRVPSLYNLRAPGRLASLFTLFLILSGVYFFHAWTIKRAPGRWSRWGLVGVSAIALVHLLEVAPLLRPIPAQASAPIGGVFSDDEIEVLRAVGKEYDVVLVSPAARAMPQWTPVAYSLVYYLDLKSNLNYIARAKKAHGVFVAREKERITFGQWGSIPEGYGNVLIAIPTSYSDKLRLQVSDRYEEIQVGGVSLWSKRNNQ